MAAKVVMVAVPTVLGIASIRVYTVSEGSSDGLITREKLNIYNPLPQKTSVQFVPDPPGVIEGGLTTARTSILPVIQAVKGACISVKRGSVNLYHAGEDVYYYLKDPPPSFLPRFGTITMAGILGMFLTRKGSSFKKTVVPLAMMSVGASACYPAQAVALFKVTGKKVYAAGQWSSGALSSLLTSKSQEPAAKEIAASQPQEATKPNPVSPVIVEDQSSSCHASEPSSAQNTAVPETEVESTESVPVSGLAVKSVPVEVESSPSPNELPASEDISTEVSTTEPTPSTEPETETVASAPGECAPAEPAPVEPAQTESAPVELVQIESAPVEPAQTQSAPVELVQTESAPVEPARTESAPVEPAQTESAPVEPAQTESAPVEPAQTESAPVEPAQTESAPVEPAQTESAPVEPALIDPAPAESASLEPASVEHVTTESAPVEPALTESAMSESAPVESASDEPAQSASAEPAPGESAQMEPAPAEPAPSESAQAESAPVESAFVPEEPAAPKLADEPAVAVVESAEAVPAVEEAPTQTQTPPPSEQVAAENSKGGSHGFKPDPSIMDFGQSNPEDEDLYSTRS